MNNQGLILLVLLSICLVSCKNANQTLPVLGEMVYDKESGEMTTYKAPYFQLMNQNNELVSATDYEGKIQVVDFFFTSCPTICPIMTHHLDVVNKYFKGSDYLELISFSIDPERDVPSRLKKYIKQKEIDDSNWTFLTGNKEKIYELAKDYKVSVFNDGTPEKEDILHDGTFVLIDEIGQIRGYYDGLERDDMKRLINDIHLLSISN